MFYKLVHRLRYILAVIALCFAATGCTTDELRCKVAYDMELPPFSSWSGVGQAEPVFTTDTLTVESYYEKKQTVTVSCPRTDHKYKNVDVAKLVTLEGTPLDTQLSNINNDGAMITLFGNWIVMFRELAGPWDVNHTFLIFSCIALIVLLIVVNKITDDNPVGIVGTIFSLLLAAALFMFMFTTLVYIEELVFDYPDSWSVWQIIGYYILLFAGCITAIIAFVKLIDTSGSVAGSKRYCYPGLWCFAVWMVTYWFYGELYTSQFVTAYMCLVGASLVADVVKYNDNPFRMAFAIAGTLFMWTFMIYMFFILAAVVIVMLLLKGGSSGAGESGTYEEKEREETKYMQGHDGNTYEHRPGDPDWLWHNTHSGGRAIKAGAGDFTPQ